MATNQPIPLVRIEDRRFLEIQFGPLPNNRVIVDFRSRDTTLPHSVVYGEIAVHNTANAAISENRFTGDQRWIVDDVNIPIALIRHAALYVIGVDNVKYYSSASVNFHGWNSLRHSVNEFKNPSLVYDLQNLFHLKKESSQLNEERETL